VAVSFLRWRFEDPYDPYLSNTYEFAINPNAMTSPFPRRNITAKATTAINGRTLLTEGQRQPAEWTFSGDFLEANHYEALRSWVLDRVGRRLFLYDHFGRKLTVVPLQFNPTPKRVIARYWRHTYEITCLVLNIDGPTFRVDAPYAPRQVVAAGKYERATVRWQPPLSARGSAILYYTITDDVTGDTHRVDAGEDLIDYWAKRSVGNHTFTVTATSTAGESAPATSAPTYVDPIVGPFGIQITSATTTYDKATIKWSAPTDNGGSEVTGYVVSARQVSSSTFGNGSWSLPADARSYTFTGLASFANTYELSVAGVNARATGPAATKTVKTLMADGPSSPVITKLVATSASIRVEWEAPVRDGGFPIRDYSVVVESFVGGQNGDVYEQGLPPTTRGYTAIRLRPGVLYRVSVYASNTKALGSAGKTGVNIKTITTLKG
jgi:hypothetical protein